MHVVKKGNADVVCKINRDLHHFDKVYYNDPYAYNSMMTKKNASIKKQNNGSSIFFSIRKF